MSNELINAEINELYTKEDIDFLVEFEEMNAKVKLMKKEKDEKLIEIFKKYNVKSFKNDRIEMIYIAPTTRKTIDVEALKAQGLYDSFLKESPVKESIRITLKYE